MAKKNLNIDNVSAQKNIIVFTDGSSRGNPGPGGWGAVIASDINVYELAGSEADTTNNRMELTALIQTLKFLAEHEQQKAAVTINTDSKYVINGAQKWIFGWQKRDWMTANKTPVQNKDLWELVAELQELFTSLQYNHVRGHVGIGGNERADTLATEAADKTLSELYCGSRNAYPFSLESDQSEASVTHSSKGKAYCYLSQVNGEIQVHNNWDDCKRRVSGLSGAKFRRANSKAEKETIIKQWESS